MMDSPEHSLFLFIPLPVELMLRADLVSEWDPEPEHPPAAPGSSRNTRKAALNHPENTQLPSCSQLHTAPHLHQPNPEENGVSAMSLSPRSDHGTKSQSRIKSVL